MIKVVTEKVRFSYCHVFEPTAMEEGGAEKYSIVLLIPKSDKATVAKINAAIAETKETSKDKWEGKIPPNLKLPLRDGDIERPDKPEYEGCYFLSASSMSKPNVVDDRLNRIIDPEEFYSGCYGRASINFYAFNKKGNKGIACGLLNVQKLEDGERLSGGRSNPEDDFGSAGLLD